MYDENYKTLLKEIKEINKWKHIPCSWKRRPTIVKMPILTKAMHRLSSLNQNPSDVNGEILKTHVKIHEGS